MGGANQKSIRTGTLTQNVFDYSRLAAFTLAADLYLKAIIFLLAGPVQSKETLRPPPVALGSSP